MNKYLSRLTSSARGETFNPLIYPSLIATLVYGLGFTFFSWTDTVSHSSLFTAMISIHEFIPVVWGVVALLVIVVGFTFLLFNVPPAGKSSGIAGFMLWVFAGFCWILTGGWFVTLAVGLPNMWFWFWQYLSLSHFNREVDADRQSMIDYDDGGYDNQDHPKDSKTAREDNRGANLQ